MNTLQDGFCDQDKMTADSEFTNLKKMEKILRTAE